MNLQQSARKRADELTADRLAIQKFAVGQSVPRKEDPLLLRGRGNYTDDVSLPGPSLCRDGSEPLRPRHHPRHR